MKNPHFPTRLLPLVILQTALFLPSFLHAQVDGDWILNGNGDWATATNWSSDPLIPGGAESHVTFTIAIGGARTVTLDGDSRTVGILDIGTASGGGGWNLEAINGAELIFDNGLNPAELNFTATSRSDFVRAPIRLGSSLTVANASDEFKQVAADGHSISAASAGTKVITNTGTGAGRVWLQKIEDGDGVVSVVQNSATSALILGRSGDENTYSGGTTIEQGVVFVSNATAFGTGTLTINGGTINNSGSSGAPINTEIIANADIRFLSAESGTGAFTLNEDVLITDNIDFFIGKSQVTIANGTTLSDGGNGYSLTKTGDGILFLTSNGITTHTGGTIIKEGTLTVAGVGNHLADTAPLTIDGGTLNMATNATVGAVTLIDGEITGSGTNTFTGSSYEVRSGTVSRGLAGTGSELTKTESGEVILSAANTYTGATSVNDGVLRVTETGSIHNSSAITVAAGAELSYNSSTARTGAITLNGTIGERAILSGNGQFNFALSLNSVGDTLSPGNSPGTMTFGTSQTWESFTYVWEVNDFTGLDAGDDFDQILITGGLNLTGGNGAYVLDIISLDALNVAGDVPNFSEIAREWVVLSTTTGISGFDADNWTLDSSAFSSDPAWAGTWSLALVGDDLVLSYAPIPEPAAAVALLAVVALVFVLRRKKIGSTS